MKKAILMNTFNNSKLPAFEKGSVKNTDFVLTQLSAGACYSTGLRPSKRVCPVFSTPPCWGRGHASTGAVWSVSQCRGTSIGAAAVTRMTYI